jgi:hypothetical protein
VRATSVVMPAVTLSGRGGVLASLEIMISGGPVRVLTSTGLTACHIEQPHR